MARAAGPGSGSGALPVPGGLGQAIGYGVRSHADAAFLAASLSARAAEQAVAHDTRLPRRLALRPAILLAPASAPGAHSPPRRDRGGRSGGSMCGGTRPVGPVRASAVEGR